MAKTRMNEAHRQVLREFAFKKIDEVIDYKPEQKLYKKLVQKTNAALRKKFPEKDMEVLAKYELTTNDRCLKFLYPSGRVHGLNFTHSEEEQLKLQDVPYSRTCRSACTAPLPMDEEFEILLDEYEKAKEENLKIRRAKITDCTTLINFAKYVEDVLEVIKVPEEVRVRLCAKSTALVALTPEVIERIQKDFSA